MSVLGAGCGGGGASPESPPPTTITSVTVSCSPTQIQVSQASQCSATVQGTSNFSSAVTWSIQGAGTINSSGLYTAPASAPSPPQIVVRATSAQDPSKSGTASVTITQLPPPITVSVSPTTATVPVNSTQQFIATVQNSSDTSVAWQVNGVTGGDSTHGTISTTGLYTAPSSVPSPSTVTVTAVSQADPTKSASVSLAITSSNISVSVSPRLAALTTTQSQQFTATVQDTSNTSVTWSVDGNLGGDSTVGTISPSGLYTPPSAAGTHTITATSVADPTQSASAMVAVTDYAGTFTYHNDTARTGQNLREFALTPATVNQIQFGMIFSCVVDGNVYAQPLYVANLAIPGQGTHNVVFVATEHDSVFAFDADNPACSQLWMTSFVDPNAGITTVPSDDVLTNDIVPEIGITGTPVIDPQSRTLYVVAKTKENGSYLQRLHALDITTGAEKFGGPVVIQASVPGTGDGNDGLGNVPFDPLRQLQRAALLLANSVVYVAFGSHGDIDPYHGWLLGYDAATLQQVAVFNTTPNGSQGAIWQSGDGPSADASGNIFVITGNGTFDADAGGVDFGESFLRLSTNAGGLTLVDFFTAFNHALLDANDQDLGSSGPLLLPDQTGTAHPHLILGAGKDGNGYLVDRDNMGQFNPADNSRIVQTIAIFPNAIFGAPAFWENNVYFLAQGDVLKAFQLSGGLLSTTPTSQASTVFGFPGGTPVISANGSTNGIVWVLDNSAFGTSGPAVLHAHDATNVATELWNSRQAANSRDQAGPAVKFTVPTVVNGRVYVGGQNQLTVFGLLP